MRVATFFFFPWNCQKKNKTLKQHNLLWRSINPLHKPNTATTWMRRMNCTHHYQKIRAIHSEFFEMPAHSGRYSHKNVTLWLISTIHGMHQYTGLLISCQQNSSVYLKKKKKNFQLFMQHRQNMCILYFFFTSISMLILKMKRRK